MADRAPPTGSPIPASALTIRILAGENPSGEGGSSLFSGPLLLSLAGYVISAARQRSYFCGIVLLYRTSPSSRRTAARVCHKGHLNLQGSGLPYSAVFRPICRHPVPPRRNKRQIRYALSILTKRPSNEVNGLSVNQMFLMLLSGVPSSSDT